MERGGAILLNQNRTEIFQFPRKLHDSGVQEEGESMVRADREPSLVAVIALPVVTRSK